MKKHLLAWILLITYLALLVRIMIFKVVPVITSGQVTLDFGGVNGGHPTNFTPFATILPYLLGQSGPTVAFLNLAGNIALLIPIGFLASLIYQNNTWKKSLILGAATGLAIEIMQTMLRVGIFDIDDVILNALGVVIGYWIFIFVAQWVREKKYKNIAISAVITVIAAITALYIMYPSDQTMLSPSEDRNSNQSDHPGNDKDKVSQKNDLCRGTGGTGEITDSGNRTITLKRKDGVSQIIHLTDQTAINSSTGSITESELRIGDRVTVVIDESETATLVLVCSEP
jgi:glycopeptide antibiotics resistance protein